MQHPDSNSHGQMPDRNYIELTSSPDFRRMVEYEKFVLKNGLRVIFHHDPHTPMAAVSVLYDVGSKDEMQDKTGFTHLFEHLMFSGSANAPDFDDIIQTAGGENNAYTNSDMTHFYNILPVDNLETVLFLEADRMANLVISEKAFTTQRNVVLEEFMETTFNQPYGDAWHHVLGMVYESHPYRWPTIGSDPDHIRLAELKDVERFYHSHYQPSNAILAIGGNLELTNVENLVNKYFGAIPPCSVPQRMYPREGNQQGIRRKKVYADVPSNAIYMNFRMCERADERYYAQDLLSDVLANGPSSRLVGKLVEEDSIFLNLDAYVYGTIEPGLLIIEGQVSEDVDIEDAEKAVWEELAVLREKRIPEEELTSQLNKVRTNLIMSETSVLGKVMSLAYYELLNDIDLINTEGEHYDKVTTEDLLFEANQIFSENNCSVLWYLKNQ